MEQRSVVADRPEVPPAAPRPVGVRRMFDVMELRRALTTTGADPGLHRRTGRRRHARPGARRRPLRAERRQPPGLAGRGGAGPVDPTPDPGRLPRRLVRVPRPARRRAHAVVAAATTAPPKPTRSAAPMPSPRSASPDGFAERLDEVPVLLAVLVDLGALAAVDRDLDRYTFAGAASVYPFAWNLLLAAREEGLGGVHHHDGDPRRVRGPRRARRARRVRGRRSARARSPHPHLHQADAR